ncbi:MAG: hypothetical protein AAGA55_03995 [Planctomycetota bacterium]
MSERRVEFGKRRLIRRRLLPFVAWICAVLGLLAVLQFVVGRTVTDRVHLIQYVWWTPPVWSVLSAWGLLCLSWLAGWASLRTRGLMLRPVLLVGCVGMTAWVLFGEWSMHRYVIGRGLTEPGDASLRVLHWNQSSNPIPPGIGERILARSPDLVALVNARRRPSRSDVLAALSPMAPGERVYRLAWGVEAPVEPGHAFLGPNLIVASRHPIRRCAIVDLPMIEGADEAWRSASLPGWVAFVEVELDEAASSAIGRETAVVWIADMPSDPKLSRRSVIEAAAEVTAAWTGPAMVARSSLGDSAGAAEVVHGDRKDPDHDWVVEPVARSWSGFPTPDLVIGDFNIMEDSASLGLLTPGMFDVGVRHGRGPMRTWLPVVKNRWLRQAAKMSSWRIDLAYVPEGTPVHAYDLVDMFGAPHTAQVIEFTPRSVGTD